MSIETTCALESNRITCIARQMEKPRAKSQLTLIKLSQVVRAELIGPITHQILLFDTK